METLTGQLPLHTRTPGACVVASFHSLSTEWVISIAQAARKMCTLLIVQRMLIFQGFIIRPGKEDAVDKIGIQVSLMGNLIFI